MAKTENEQSREGYKEQAILESKKIFFFLYRHLGLEEHFDFSHSAKKLEGKLIYELLKFNNAEHFNFNDRFLIEINNETNEKLKIGSIILKIIADKKLSIDSFKQIAALLSLVDSDLEFESKRLVWKIKKHLLMGQIIQARFHLNKNQSSNNPMVYARDMHDLKIVYNSERHEFLTDMGWVSLEDCSQVDVFCQQAAIKKKGLTGFTNDSEIKKEKIALGGGMRIQFDAVEDDEFIFTVSSVFDDVGTRATAREGDFYNSLPFFQKKIAVRLNENGELVYVGPKFSDVKRSKNIEDYLDYILANIFETNGKQIANLFIALNEVRPAFEEYSIEIAFSLQGNKLKIKITSSDGICTYLDLSNEITSTVDVNEKNRDLLNIMPNLDFQNLVKSFFLNIPFRENDLVSVEHQRNIAFKELSLLLQEKSINKEAFEALIKDLESHVSKMSSSDDEFTISTALGSIIKAHQLVNHEANAKTWNLTQESELKSSLLHNDFSLVVFNAASDFLERLVYLEIQGMPLAYLFKKDGSLVKESESHLDPVPANVISFAQNQLNTLLGANIPNLSSSNFREGE